MNPKNIIIALIITAIVLATFIGARTPRIPSQSEENVQVKEVTIEKETSVSDELLPFEPYDVPLDEDLQYFLYQLSERYSIPMELILAVIGQESNYDPSKIGDNGNSYGLMQIQPKWHEERMAKYNVSDLLNPWENCLIGVDYLAECIDRFGVEYGLIAYNAGPDDAVAMKQIGVITEYAESVMVLADMLNKEVINESI